MSSTYYSNRWFLNAAAVQTAMPVRFLPDGSGVNVLGIYSLGGSYGLADVFNMIPITPAASFATTSLYASQPTVIGALLDVDSLDTGGTPTLTLNVGTIGTAAAFYSAVTTGRAGGYATPNVAGTLGFTAFQVNDIVGVKVAAAAQVAATTGKIRLLFEYSYDP